MLWFVCLVFVWLFVSLRELVCFGVYLLSVFLVFVI